MRIGVIDIGTNSTRLLVADVEGDRLEEVERCTSVTRLGHGVDRTGRLDEDAISRVLNVIGEYGEKLSSHGCKRTIAVATSAVRDAANGRQFTDEIESRFGLPVEVLSGEREASLTFRGATHDLDRESGRATQTLVIDIGGGSTEFVAGSNSDISFYVSTQLGCVRHSERFLEGDPPDRGRLDRLCEDVKATVESSVVGSFAEPISEAIAVAGTATSLAAIDQELEPYDPSRVHGYVLTLDSCRAIIDRMAGMPLAERVKIAGLHPDRAPTIVAGAAILITSMTCLQLDCVTVSEHDMMHGAALVEMGKKPA